MLYMVTFTINIPPMLAYIPYMDPMGISLNHPLLFLSIAPDGIPHFACRLSVPRHWIVGLFSLASERDVGDRFSKGKPVVLAWF